MSPQPRLAHAPRRPPAPDALAFADARHLAALEDLCPGILLWIDGAWRRNGAHDRRPHASDTINALLRHGLATTSCDNIVITPQGSKARDALARRTANFQKLKDLCR